MTSKLPLLDGSSDEPTWSIWQLRACGEMICVRLVGEESPRVGGMHVENPEPRPGFAHLLRMGGCIFVSFELGEPMVETNAHIRMDTKKEECKGQRTASLLTP